MKIYTDGSYIKKYDLCGWAFVLIDNGMAIHIEYGAEHSKLKANYAEAIAVFNAAKYVKENQLKGVLINYDTLFINHLISGDFKSTETEYIVKFLNACIKDNTIKLKRPEFNKYKTIPHHAAYTAIIQHYTNNKKELK